MVSRYWSSHLNQKDNLGRDSITGFENLRSELESWQATNWNNLTADLERAVPRKRRVRSASDSRIIYKYAWNDKFRYVRGGYLRSRSASKSLALRRNFSTTEKSELNALSMISCNLIQAFQDYHLEFHYNFVGSNDSGLNIEHKLHEI